MKKHIRISTAILSIFLLAACSTAAPTSSTGTETKTDLPVVSDTENSTEQDGQTFNITARNFAFSQTTLTVNQGEQVKIILTSQEGMHDWVVDEFDAATTIVRTGETTEVTFIADKAGTFEYYCSVGNHREMGMVGVLNVQPIE